MNITDYKPEESYMKLAINVAKENFKTGAGGPFGACIVKNGKVISISSNSVLKNDPTAHAEVNAIRLASKELETYDLSGCVIYSTTEPCPMCFSAIHWANIDLIVYGTKIEDVAVLGFNELSISNEHMKTEGGSSVGIIPGFMKNDCLKLLDDWTKQENKKVY